MAQGAGFTNADQPARDTAPPIGASRTVTTAIIGTGRVGGAIARALRRRGHLIVAASARTNESALRFAEGFPGVEIADSQTAASLAELVVLAVPDDAIDEVAGLVAKGRRTSATVIHTSGLFGLRPIADCGERIAAIHPAQAISWPGTDLTGAWFGVTCEPQMREWSEWFVAEIGGNVVHIAEKARAEYHAALCIASNFAVSLAGDAQDLLPDRRILLPLLRQTLDNIAEQGPDAALTGPIVRGDAGTVRAHLRAIPPALREMYRANGRRALARAISAGRLDSAGAQAVAAELEQSRP
ncbi:MAG: hypothetical protein NVSMB57_14450 [Actinomycetota bacterium]